jgi:hypothetical protein
MACERLTARTTTDDHSLLTLMRVRIVGATLLIGDQRAKGMELKVIDTRTRRSGHEDLPEAKSLRNVAERIPALSTYERSEERRQILAFLRGRVGPRTGLDDLLLYPEVGNRSGERLVKASMNYDHLAIRHWAELLAAADVADTARLQALLYGLDALIRVQMWKENELVLAALESPSLQLALAG